MQRGKQSRGRKSSWHMCLILMLERCQSFRGGTDPAQMPWWFYTDGLGQLSTWKIGLFWAFIRTTSSTWGSLGRTFMISQHHHIVRPDGKHKPASKKNHLQSFRQDTQAQGSSGCKSGSPPEERELFHTGSSWLAATNTVQEKFPLLQVFFQCFRKFSHSTTVQSQGCSQGLSQQDKSFECAASCEHQSGCSRWTMGENTEQEAKDITM